MKKSIKAITLALSLALSFSTIPTLCCSAYYSNDTYYREYIIPEKVSVDFVTLAYKNNDGELTITGCYDYDPNLTVNPYNNGKIYGFVAVSVVDGVLEIPSHIDGNPVVDINNLSGNKTFDTIVVPDAITKILKSAFCDCDYKVETADDEFRIATMYGTSTK